MRIILIALLLIHGLIHLLGFLKAFGLANINQLTQFISKPVGWVWLLISVLFVSDAVLIVLKKDWWPFLAFLAILFSQILIIFYWKDAKFATIANSIIFVVSLIGYGEFQFNRMVRNEAKEVSDNLNLEHIPRIRKADVSHLPLIVQKWLIGSGEMENEKVVSVQLSQKGEMKTSPNGKWMGFTANQYFNCTKPSFIWTTDVKAQPLAFLKGRDLLINGKGQMLIKLYSLIPVVDERFNENINTANMQRFLAEMCWFPTAAINDYILWEEVGQNSAKATMTLNDSPVSGIFRFSPEGELLSFETFRFYRDGEGDGLEKWHIEMMDYKEFNGIKIPNKCKVTWKLKEGDFNWLNLEITALEKNKLPETLEIYRFQ